MLAENQSSVRDVVELSGGTTVTRDHLAYDAYGKLSQTDSSYALTFSYTGRQYDAAVDLYYLLCPVVRCRDVWIHRRGPAGFRRRRRESRPLLRQQPDEFYRSCGIPYKERG
jgi:hypothetical protein